MTRQATINIMVDMHFSMLNLCASAQKVIDNWESGDLAGAVNELEGDLIKGRRLIARYNKLKAISKQGFAGKVRIVAAKQKKTTRKIST